MNQKFVANPDSDEIHPRLMPLEFDAAHGAGEAINLFEEKVLAITDSDYGDFMRKAQTYFLEMLPELGARAEEVRARLLWIEEYLQFRPSWDVDSTRARLLVDIEQIRFALVSN